MENELYHYGVKGMKWGVRKDPLASKLRDYRTSRKTDPKTDFMKINRANSAARNYYRAQLTDNFQTHKKQNALMDRKISGLTKEQVENGRYRVARARNIKRKTVSSLIGVGTTLATASAFGPAAPVVGGIVGVGANFVTGGHYYQQESAAYGRRRAIRELKQ